MWPTPRSTTSTRSSTGNNSGPDPTQNGCLRVLRQPFFIRTAILSESQFPPPLRPVSLLPGVVPAMSATCRSALSVKSGFRSLPLRSAQNPNPATAGRPIHYAPYRCPAATRALTPGHPSPPTQPPISPPSTRIYAASPLQTTQLTRKHPHTESPLQTVYFVCKHPHIRRITTANRRSNLPRQPLPLPPFCSSPQPPLPTIVSLFREPPRSSGRQPSGLPHPNFCPNTRHHSTVRPIRPAPYTAQPITAAIPRPNADFRTERCRKTCLSSEISFILQENIGCSSTDHPQTARTRPAANRRQ